MFYLMDFNVTVSCISFIIRQAHLFVPKKKCFSFPRINLRFVFPLWITSRLDNLFLILYFNMSGAEKSFVNVLKCRNCQQSLFYTCLKKRFFYQMTPMKNRILNVYFQELSTNMGTFDF